ncbi:CDP-alcohol phosphatidyltransferase family protein [Polymorphobacter fuscus]|uniref:CDP-alcohol phosphatidyltransferase family protein n=1 Tax=Sandarakinorhabdus fusca TaxID=1439888 RepID=UPI00143022EA|nr:CDP-alcohol phosphatidyltransferase family protein [Polymorphobacter fuscus]NJC07798.1 phosphatidylglycerophosphate synthase [Polymorphobacter fuscus]
MTIIATPAATAPRAANTAARAARPAMIEDPSNLWLVHPLSERLLAPALRLGIHPNMVSFTGMGFGALAGAFYAHWQQPLAVVAGFLLMVGWHVMDGLDGKLARASGKASPLGRLIDGLCDYMVFFVVMLPIVFSFADWQPVLALAVVSGICHAVQSAWYEGEREAWKRRARGVFHVEPRSARFWGEAFYNSVEARLGGGAKAIDAVLAAHPDRLDAYLDATAPLLRRLSILSANSRTLVIALACLAGNPRLYWYWEIIGLSAIAIGLALLLRRRERTLA